MAIKKENLPLLGSIMGEYRKNPVDVESQGVDIIVDQAVSP